MLCAFAWFVSNVVSTCRTIFNRNTRDWHTDAAQEDQPTPNDLTQETHRAETTGAPQALMVSSTQSVRPSNHEGVLTTGSVFKEHAFPAKAGIQSARNARSQQGAALSPLVPTNVGIQGEWRALSRACSFNSAHAAQLFLDPDVRRDER